MPKTDNPVAFLKLLSWVEIKQVWKSVNPPTNTPQQLPIFFEQCVPRLKDSLWEKSSHQLHHLLPWKKVNTMVNLIYSCPNSRLRAYLRFSVPWFGALAYIY